MIRDESFPAVAKRARAAVVARIGLKDAKPFMLVIDLIELLAFDVLPAEKLRPRLEVHPDKPEKEPGGLLS